MADRDTKTRTSDRSGRKTGQKAARGTSKAGGARRERSGASAASAAGGQTGTIYRLTAVPPRERPVLLVAALAVVAMVTMALTGGPQQPRVQDTSPQIARLIEVEELDLRPITPRAPGQPTMALVRVPDRPAALSHYFAAMNYRLNRVREGGPEVPRVYVQEVPEGLAKYGPVDRKKALFVRMMLPLVLKANEKVARDRTRIERLRGRVAAGQDLSKRDALWLRDVAERYRTPAETAAEVDFGELLTRVDVVPPSLAITQSILESGWGSSRFARKGNALFGQRTWDEDTPGLAPQKAEGFKVRAFENLGQSVEAYVHNLNTTGAYAALRRQRADMRAKGQRIDGYRLAGTLLKYSEEGQHYVEKLRGLMAHNGLRAFDDAALRRQVIAQRVIPDSEVDDIEVALAPQAGS